MADSIINVKVDTSGIVSKIRKICQNKKLGQIVAEAGMKYMNEHYVPMLDGALRKSSVSKPFTITWTAHYAHRHWSGYGDGSRNTPGTRSHWEEPKDVKAYIAKAAQDWMKR